jgi:hypothetical protein
MVGNVAYLGGEQSMDLFGVVRDLFRLRNYPSSDTCVR